jgi:hypothetical protein
MTNDRDAMYTSFVKILATANITANAKSLRDLVIVHQIHTWMELSRKRGDTPKLIKAKTFAMKLHVSLLFVVALM